jgi:hypothetical protein
LHNCTLSIHTISPISMGDKKREYGHYNEAI